MARYIDAAPYEDGRIVFNKEDAGVPVAEIPTADVVERKKGNWIYSCSVCNYYSGTKRTNFCPNCGADMRGEKR